MIRTILFFSALILCAPCLAVEIETVPVGNPGNPKDPASGNFFGSVSYAYRIGTYEVTNSQYAAFLSEKAESDPLGLYNASMGSNVRGGITRSGVSGSFTYAVKTDMGNKPVNFVGWFDSIRFANWLNNGQGTGNTETGSYTLLGGTPKPSNGPFITRNVGATWFLTSLNEWYKAAYYQPAAEGGDVDNYWLYPTASNSIPTQAAADVVGNISNPGANVANYNSGADWNGQNGNVTTIGSAGPLSKSFYGTFDQGGNIFEWNDDPSISTRSLAGGSWGSDLSGLRATFRPSTLPADETDNIGFRVATVPEPSTLVLAAVGGLLLLWRVKRRRGRADWPAS